MTETNKTLTVVEQNAAVSREKLLEFLKIAGVAPKLTEQEKVQFVEIAQAYHLNPFKREIYCNTYGEGQYRTTSIITGYEVYIKRAERTGQLNGWHVEVSGNVQDGSLKAVITIYRKDWDRPFTHEVYYEEVCQRKKDGKLNAIWGKMPRFMTKKVAIAQGFRLCFSDELGGMPYTADELPQEEKTAQDTASKPQAVTALCEEEKADILTAQNEQELTQVCRDLFGKYPACKKELTDLFNRRLDELLKAKENNPQENTHD